MSPSVSVYSEGAWPSKPDTIVRCALLAEREVAIANRRRTTMKTRRNKEILK
jgi:hypothetical protein